MKLQANLLAISLLSCATSTSTVWASSYYDSNPYEINKVYTSSKITVESNNSVVPLSVITSRDIERFGIQNFEQLFLLIPQLSVSFDDTGIDVINGISKNEPLRMQVLIDGIVAYGSGVLEMHWDKLPITISEIQRVEIVHSPSSSVYGSNAYENIINIITKKPQAIGDQVRYIERGFERRFYGHMIIGDMYSNGSPDWFHHNTGISIYYVDSDGYNSLESPWNKLTLSARSEMLLGDDQMLDLSLRYTEMDTKHWDSSWEGQAPDNESKDVAIRLDYENRLTDKSFLKILASADIQKEFMTLSANFNPLLFIEETKVLAEMYDLNMGDIDNIPNLPMTPELMAFLQQYGTWVALGSPLYRMDAQLKNNTERYYTGFDYLYDINQKLRSSFSSNVRYEKYDTDFAESKDFSYQLNHATEVVYTSDRYDAILQAAVMAERIQNYDYEYPYRLGFNAGLTDDVRLRGTYDTSFRWPSPFERLGRLDIYIYGAEDNPFGVGNGSSFAFYQQANNTHLKPESVSSAKMGFIISDTGLGERSSDSVIEVTGYFNKYDDVITNSLTLDRSVLDNDGEMERFGVDASLIGEYSHLYYRIGASWAQDSNRSFYDSVNSNFDENVDQFAFTSALSYSIEDTVLRGKYFWRYIPDEVNRSMYSAGASYKGIEDTIINLDTQYVPNGESWSQSFNNRPDDWIVTAELVFDF